MNDLRDERVFSAVAALRAFMNEHLAASKIELEAKLIDVHFGWPPFEPHHLHNAIRYLAARDELTRVEEPTRGGRRPPLLLSADTTGRSREQSDVAARKRLLMSRYYSYVEGSKGRESSLAGPAGEIAFHTALLSANVGTPMSTLTRGRPSLDTVMSRPVPIGPLDNGFVLQRFDTTGQPVGPWGVQVLVEVKNIREWIYPRTQELYQVLLKAALIKRAHPEALVLPMLVCRRAHVTTNFMAKDLGFFVIHARRQFLPSNHTLINNDHLGEVRAELGLADLVQGLEESSLKLLKGGLRALQRSYDVEEACERWGRFSSSDAILRCFEVLASERTYNRARDETLAELRQEVKALGASAGW